MLASVSVYGADTKSTTIPFAQKNQQSQTAQPKVPNYTWQECVEDYTKESGYSQQEAYKKCDNLTQK